jgi:RNA polymerase sigma factor (sigma-70 family)
MVASTSTWLNRIETNWALVDRAHREEGSLAAFARHNLLERYYGAACRYLLAATRNEGIAEELIQEFALRLIRGDFRRAEPQRGRFRDYVKSVLINLVHDYRRRVYGGQLPNDVAAPDRAGDLVDADADDVFLTSWRDELLHRAWAALEETHATLYAVLLVHVQNPGTTANDKAEQVGRQLGDSFSANRFRVMLHRAREKFSLLLRSEVTDSLIDPTPEELRSELRQLRLLQYCDA